jgi:hypothetical protein
MASISSGRFPVPTPGVPTAASAAANSGTAGESLNHVNVVDQSHQTQTPPEDITQTRLREIKAEKDLLPLLSPQQIIPLLKKKTSSDWKHFFHFINPAKFLDLFAVDVEQENHQNNIILTKFSGKLQTAPLLMSFPT